MFKIKNIISFLSFNIIIVATCICIAFILMSLKYDSIYLEFKYNDLTFFISLMIYILLICCAVLFVIYKLGSKNLPVAILNSLIIILATISLSFYKKEEIYNFFTQTIYVKIDNHIKTFESNNKNLFNTKEYAEFLLDKSNNDPNNLKKYHKLNNNLDYKLDGILPIEKRDYVSLILLKENQSLPMNIRNKINEITVDKVISIKEKKDFEDFIMNLSDKEYNTVSLLIDSMGMY